MQLSMITYGDHMHNLIINFAPYFKLAMMIAQLCQKYILVELQNIEIVPLRIFSSQLLVSFQLYVVD